MPAAAENVITATYRCESGQTVIARFDDATLSEMLMDHTAPEPVEIEACTARPAG
jgi:hypothetical protein